MTVAASFTAVGNGGEILVPDKQQLTYDVSGTFVGTVILQQFVNGGWNTIASATGAASGTVVVNAGNKARGRFRFRCSAFTSGTIVTSLADVTSDAEIDIRDANGNVVLKITEDGVEVPSGKVLTATAAVLTSPNLTTPLGAIVAIERTFTETAGAGVWTGSVAVPAGATILDIIVNGVALWDSETSATMKVGDAADDDGYFTGINLKATDLLAGESLSFALAGGKAGAYIANSQVSPRYSATARVISGIITKVGTTGSAGRTRMLVLYALPVTADIVAATKV